MGLTYSMFAYYMGWGLFGITLSYAQQRIKNNTMIKTTGGFSWGFFIRDNFWRFVWALGSIILVVAFTSKFTGHEISEWEVFLSGFTNDKVVDTIKSRKREQ